MDLAEIGESCQELYDFLMLGGDGGRERFSFRLS